jgi:hypothetical protein
VGAAIEEAAGAEAATVEGQDLGAAPLAVSRRGKRLKGIRTCQLVDAATPDAVATQIQARQGSSPFPQSSSLHANGIITKQ